MKYSVSGGGNNTNLLQEEKENIAKEANNNAAVNTELKKMITRRTWLLQYNKRGIL